MKHYPFPKIRQYHQVLRDLKLRHTYVGKDEAGEPIYDNTRELPTITFHGHVKLHGTNAAIVFDADGTTYAQSRENVIDEIKDNAGFAHWVVKEGHRLRERITFAPGMKSVVYGEWCGGSIQKGVALNQLQKMFVVFGLKVVNDMGESQWQDSKHIQDESISVHHICRAPTFVVEVDLNRPDKAIETMTQWVDAIDTECPFAKCFGVSGHGEGLVFTPLADHGFDCAFKVKGESHSKSKIKKLPTVDCAKMDGIHQAVETHCHEDRLEQGWNAVIQSEEDKVPQKIADFIRWVVNDLWEEEGDSIRASDISRKEIGAAVSKKAARWFQNKLREL